MASASSDILPVDLLLKKGHLWFVIILAWLQGRPYFYQEELAILFTDIVGFSEKTKQTARPEDQMVIFRYLLLHYQPNLRRAVQNNEGRVVKFLGDGMMAVFPQAHQAVQSAWEILETLDNKEGSSSRSLDFDLETKLAIDSGYVLHSIEGPPWRQQHDFFGEPVNTAAHLANAGPASVPLISLNAYKRLAKQPDRPDHPHNAARNCGYTPDARCQLQTGDLPAKR